MELDKSKQKASTSAAASTLGIAAVLSVVSNALSSDTEDESQGDVWNEENLNKSQVRSPKKQMPSKDNEPKPIEPLFKFHHDGAFRDEIEVEIQTKNQLQG